MNYAVTGGAGFIGSHLIDRLLELGHRVVCIDNLSSGKEENIAHNFDNSCFKFYIRDIQDSLSDIFMKESLDGVFHLAAIISVQYSIQNPHETHHVNVNGTINVLNTCVKHRVPRFIFSSSAAVYGHQDVEDMHEELDTNALSPYALHKIVGEHYCKLYHMLYNMETICLRNFNVFGPRQDTLGGYAGVIPLWFRRIKNGRRCVINGDGQQTRDYIYVKDSVNAFIAAAQTQHKECFGKVFNVGSGQHLSVQDLFAHIKNLTGIDHEPEYGPTVIEVRHSRSVIDRAKEHLNWSPQIPFEQGLAEMYAHEMK
ncbi:NAD-dependent epimerase/dehydratase family protein [Candidatus Uhrbacteria bacterium]|nr:NAD-dependent epimerase/dehydratase family protein [Candidatus Uhrbacteria bacterium]